MFPGRESPPPWQVLVGPFDADAVEAQWEGGGPLLLLPNHPERAAELAAPFQDRPGLVLSRELLGAEDQEALWYRYNDSRFDGLNAPEELQPRVPNLRLREMGLRRIARLETILTNWADQDPVVAARLQGGGGRIWVRGKLPLPIVAGLGRVVELIREFRWTPLGEWPEPDGFADPRRELAPWLESSCFHPPELCPPDGGDGADSLVWRQDPLRLEIQRRQRLERQLEEERAQRRLLEAERDRQVAAQAAAERDFRARIEALQEELRRQEDSQGQLREEAARRLKEEVEAARRQPRRGDLQLCTNTADPRCGTLLVLLSGPGEPEIWESAVLQAEA